MKKLFCFTHILALLLVVSVVHGAGIADKSIGGIMDVLEAGDTTEILMGGGAGNAPVWGTPAGGDMVYPGAGIPISTGTAWDTSITDNSANWDTAYADRLKWDGGATSLVASTGRTSLGLGTAATRNAEDTLTNGTNLPDGAAIIAYGDANWGMSAGTVDTSGTPVTNDIARFTDSDTIEGRSYSELRSDLGLVIGINVQAYDATILKQSDVDDTPVDGVTTAPVSSNWAYDHVVALDPHTGYMLESNIGTGSNNYLKLSASPGTPSGTTFLSGNMTWTTPPGSMVYPGSGIAVSTGSAWTTSVANNSTNWNTAYTDRMKWDGGSTGLDSIVGRTSLGLGTASQRNAEDTMTNGSNLPDGAAVITYGNANWTGGGGWSDGGTTISLATSTDKVRIGLTSDDITPPTYTLGLSSPNLAKMIVKSNVGLQAIIGWSQSSDGNANNRMGTMGLSGYVEMDSPSTAYGAYLEARKVYSGSLDGYTYAHCHGSETAIINQVNSGIDVTPSSMIPLGSTTGVWISSGRPDVTSYPASAAIGITPCGSTFRRGIVIGATALTDLGSGGPFVALALGNYHRISWGDDTTSLLNDSTRFVFTSSGSGILATLDNTSGNMWILGDVSAISFTDRTPYPESTKEAYDAINSIEKGVNGVNHNKLHPFIAKDGSRNLSATVSAQNEVIKDLIKKVELLERSEAMRRQASGGQ